MNREKKDTGKVEGSGVGGRETQNAKSLSERLTTIQVNKRRCRRM
jgi:hypothetical protein